MADQGLPHVDIAGWLLGDLDPDEERRAAEHLAGCATCRAAADDLRDVADLALLSGPQPEPSPDLGDRVLAAVRAEAAVGDATDEVGSPAAPETTDQAVEPAVPAGPPTTRPGRRSARSWWGGRLAVGLAGAAIAVLAFVAGIALGNDAGGGELELQAQLASADGATSADVTVRKLGTGRAVDVTSADLPILPDGGLYELWFVGPGDTPESPNRISAGTFHPDEDGNTAVVLHAAVVPTEYPTVVITAEPNNGDPAPNGPEVVRSGPDD